MNPSAHLERRAVVLRVLAAAFAVAAAVLVLVPDASGQEAGSDGELGSWTLRSNAHGGHVFLDPNVYGSVPDVETTFDTGNIGYGRASMAWPGPLGGNAGDLIILASGGQIPPEMEGAFRALNYPMRAEARSPGGPAESSFDEAPGTAMRAAADDESAAAAARVERTEAPGLGTLGSASVMSESSLLDGIARSAATSENTGIEFDGGVLAIEAVHSEAVASSDGVKGTARASTTVSGVTVAGRPATLDQNGLRVGAEGEGNPVNEAANEIAEQALRESGMEVIVSQPVEETDGASATAVAGSVLIAMSPEGPFVVFGGATATASAGEGFVLTQPDLGSVAPAPPAVDAGSAAPPPPSGAEPSTPAPTDAAASAAPPAAPTPVAAPIASSSSPLLPRAEFAGVLVLCALFAVLTSRVMRRLAAGLDAAAVTCPARGAP